MSTKKRIVVFTLDSQRQLFWFPVYVRRIILSGIKSQLVQEDPSLSSRNKFRLQRPTPYADYELRIENWRVFYRIEHEDDFITKTKVTLVGKKEGNKLIIEGQEIQI